MIYIIILSVSFILYAMIYAVEAALSSANRLKIELDLIQEQRYAVVSKKLLGDNHRLTIAFSIAKIVFITLMVLSAVFILDHSFYTTTTHYWMMALGLLLLFLIVVFLGVLFPLFVTIKNPDRVLRSLYWLAYSIYIVIKPFVRERREIPENRGGVEQSSEIEMFHNALNFHEVVLRECMIPRTEIAALEESVSRDVLIKMFAETKYSRIIIYRESIDNIQGYVHTKDLFGEYESIKSIVRPIEFASEDDLAKSLLKRMIKNKQSISVLLDKYGGTAGIVTMEDIMEEIFGEISDELDAPELIAKKISDREYIFSGRFEIKHLNREYGLNLPESDDYETLAGMIAYYKENIPEEGETLEIDAYKFKILKSLKNRIESVLLSIGEELN